MFKGEYWVICRVEEILENPDVKKYVDQIDFSQEESDELRMVFEDLLEY